MELNDMMSAMSARVKQDSTHPGLRFKYASSDAVFEHVRAALAHSGLVVHQSQESSEIVDVTTYSGKTRKFLVCSFKIGLAKPTEEPRVTSIVEAGAEFTGASSWQIVRVNALKTWLRSMFVLSTGEEDAESYEQDNYQQDQVRKDSSAQTNAARAKTDQAKTDQAKGGGDKDDEYANLLQGVKKLVDKGVIPAHSLSAYKSRLIKASGKSTEERNKILASVMREMEEDVRVLEEAIDTSQ